MNKVLNKLDNLFSNARFVIIFSLVLLVLQFALQIYLAHYDSQTTDEAVHLSAGYTYLTKGDFRFNPEHPPLVKYLSAIPLTIIKPAIPTDDQYWDKSENYFYDSWQENRNFGEAMLYSLGNDAQKLLFTGRIAITILTFILGLSLFFITSKLFGKKAGIVAVVLYVTNPIVNAHGHLITTDIAVSLGFLWSVYTLWNFLQYQKYKYLIYLGIALGFTLATKFTSVILLPMILVLVISYIYKNKIDIKKAILIFVKIALSFMVAWLFICCVYQFDLKKAPKEDVAINEIASIDKQNESGFDNLIANHIDIYHDLRAFLIPRDYFKGMVMVIGHTEGGHDSFLLGKTSKQGWWYYFPFLFIVKNTIPFIAIVLISLYFLLFSKKKNEKRIFFVIASLIYLLFAMMSKANLGVRHILPMFPLIIVAVSDVINIKNNIVRFIIYLLLFLCLIESIWMFPDYLSYFNQSVGGSKNGYTIATDSNLDWGQDLKRIKNYVLKNNIINPYIVYPWNGAKSLEYENISYKNISEIDTLSPDGFLIISATYMQTPEFHWLKQYKPYDRVTNGVFVFKFTQ